MRASGSRVRLQSRFVELMDGSVSQDAMDAQAIQPYYTLFLAREAGKTITYEKTDDTVVFRVA